MSSSHLIMICDDQQIIHETLRTYLASEGFDCISAYDGEQAISVFKENDPDLVILDIMMPRKNGMDVCREIRQESRVPIIMLTAKSEEIDRVLGLELGADDYIVKPFEPKELLARVKAVLRRTSQSSDEARVVNVGDLSVSIDNYTVLVGGNRFEMPPKEIELLYFFVTHPNRVFTREQILSCVWGVDYYGDSRTIDVHVKRLRDRLGASKYWELETVWGVGYRMRINKEDLNG